MQLTQTLIALTLLLGSALATAAPAKTSSSTTIKKATTTAAPVKTTTACSKYTTVTAAINCSLQVCVKPRAAETAVAAPEIAERGVTLIPGNGSGGGGTVTLVPGNGNGGGSVSFMPGNGGVPTLSPNKPTPLTQTVTSGCTVTKVVGGPCPTCGGFVISS